MVLILNGIGFIGTGCIAIWAPDTLAASVQFSLQGSAAYSEFLATFGGLYLAYGIFLLVVRGSMIRFALLILAVTSTGLMSGRLVALALYGMPNSAQLVFWAWELATAVTAGWLLLHHRLETAEPTSPG
jgi:hypothetical protein